ncbi:Outer membrane protein beta-barrel domain-containing protein [Algoriphagus locisalis]|uniref:Outer membrane protein beta-barrel domain-containing protein n=1 Tax=Algoriphagus locisalis TaxID=305507 RepID=A0A1I6ZW97_9BACT|nr:porin family protein [Algoriphagus locisalis]SFT66932.1 Outer membrane protein beta-barrel domain-containing protein [Algoriphagus locisalis]
MKKLLAFVFVLGLFGTAHAQFGLRAGFSSANFSDFDSDPLSGFHAGAYYKIGAGFLAFEPGIQYSQKGYTNLLNGSPSTDKELLSYLDVPVLVRVNFLPFLNVFAGPQGSVLVSRNREFSDGSTESTTEPIRGYDISGVVGVGANLPLGLNAQVSYDIGFQSVNYYNQDVKNNVLKISLGYDF